MFVALCLCSFACLLICLIACAFDALVCLLLLFMCEFTSSLVCFFVCLPVCPISLAPHHASLSMHVMINPCCFEHTQPLHGHRACVCLRRGTITLRRYMHKLYLVKWAHMLPSRSHFATTRVKYYQASTNMPTLVAMM